MSDHSLRDTSLEACVQHISSVEDMPAFTQTITELMTTLEDEESNVRHVTNIILRDVSLTTRVLRAVNSAYFNRSGRPVLSISHAITLLGRNTIRNLAAGIMLFERFSHRSTSVKEIMLMCLLTANHAHILAGQAGYPGTEEAYLCGMFRGLGELLLACYFPRRYAEVLELMTRRGLRDSEACLRVNHFSYEELGRAMVKFWKLPEKVERCMLPIEQIHTRPVGDEDLLFAITAFSHMLTEGVYRLDPDRGRRQVKVLLAKFGPSLGVDSPRLQEILRAALAETRDSFDSARVPMDSLRLEKHIESAFKDFDREEAPDLEAVLPGLVPSPVDLAVLQTLAREVDAVVDSGDDYELNDVILMVLEAILRGGRFDRVLFCLVNPERTKVDARLGLGDGADELVGRFHFPVSLLSGPIGPALKLKQDVWIDWVEDSRFRGSGFSDVVSAASFCLLPLLVDGAVVGCLYFDRLTTRLAVDEKSSALLSGMRNRCAEYIERVKNRHSGS